MDIYVRPRSGVYEQSDFEELFKPLFDGKPNLLLCETQEEANLIKGYSLVFGSSVVTHVVDRRTSLVEQAVEVYGSAAVVGFFLTWDPYSVW